MHIFSATMISRSAKEDHAAVSTTLPRLPEGEEEEEQALESDVRVFGFSPTFPEGTNSCSASAASPRRSTTPPSSSGSSILSSSVSVATLDKDVPTSMEKRRILLRRRSARSYRRRSVRPVNFHNLRHLSTVRLASLWDQIRECRPVLCRKSNDSRADQISRRPTRYCSLCT